MLEEDFEYLRVEAKEKQFQEISNKKRGELEEKDTQVNELKRSLEEMTAKFATMLKVHYLHLLIDLIPLGNLGENGEEDRDGEMGIGCQRISDKQEIERTGRTLTT